MAWEDDQAWERHWHGDCIRSYGEETKQLDYAGKMGLKVEYDNYGPYIDVQGKSVLDMGGGPYSLLLKTKGCTEAWVVDPGIYPDWVMERYKTANIWYERVKGEDFKTDKVFDEVWAYNLLQHTENPEQIVRNIRSCSKIIRVFDWLEITGIGHPQNLTETKMNEWYGGLGKVNGHEYSGIFLGDHYGS